MATESPAKKLKTDGPLIGTHSGHFHADEALAVSMLRLLPTYANSPLIRTREADILGNCHTVVDVGGEYDPSKNRYDHHQRTFDTVFPGHNIKLSSAGLVYLHFGKDIIKYQTGLPEGSEELDVLFEKLYTDFIEAFDANDNGVNVIAPSDLTKAGIEKKFEDRGFTIASVVNRYNHSLSAAEKELSKEEKQAAEDARFLRASAWVGEQFVMELADRFTAWLPARAVVRQAYNERTKYDPKGRIMVVPYKKEGVPWSDHLYALEKETSAQEGLDPHVLYVLFAESGDADSKWRIRAVSKENSGFENRKDLPDAWKGVRDEELDKVSGIPGGVFVHASGFIGGNKTFDGALAMAQKALEL